MTALKIWLAVAFLMILLMIDINFYEVRAKPVLQDETAQETPSDCVGLDLILIVDHSDSMYGFGGNPPTDPNGVRISSAQYLINQMFANRLTFCPEAIHRVAVIGFGGRAEEQLSVSLINVDSDSGIEVWQQARDRLVEEVTLPDEGFGQTDFATAFAQAEQTLAQMTPLVDNLSRKKAIIVLTDGNPCIEDCGTDNSTFKAETYMEGTLLPEINATFLPWQPPYDQSRSDVYIWLVAINNGPIYLEEQRGTKTIGDLWREVTQAHGGDVFSLGQDPKNIPETYLLILNQLLAKGEAEEVKCDEPVYVDPYVQTAIFSFFKNSEDVKVEMTYEEKQLVFSNGQVGDETSDLIEDYIAFGPTETYIINRPGPGRWSVQTDCKAVLIYRQILLAQVDPPFIGTLPLVDEVPYYDEANPVYLEYRLRGKNNQPFDENPKFPLTTQATIIQPDGKIYDTFELEPIGNGKYSSKVTNKPLPQGQVGRYKLSLLITTIPANPNRSDALEIYDKELGFYDVRQVTRFDFKIMSPSDGQSFNLLNYQNGNPFPPPIEVVIQLTAADGTTPIPADGILFRPEVAFVAKFASPAGRTEEVPLQPDPTTKGQFRALLRNSGVEAINDPAGNYLVSVEFTEKEYNSNDYVPKKLKAEINLTGVEVKPVDFRVISPANNQTFPWHQAGIGCISGAVETIPLQIELTDKSGNFLDASSMLAVDPSQVFSATVTSPNGNEVDSFEIQGKQTAQGLRFQGEADAPFETGGAYRIEVKMPANGVLKAGYVPIADLRTVGFQRTDELITSPSVCRSATGLSGLILLGFLAVLGYIFSGGPRGTLLLVDKNNQPVADVISLRNWQRTNKFKVKLWKSGLEFEEATIIAKKGGGVSSTQDSPTVFVEVKDPSQNNLLSGEIEKGKHRLSPTVFLKYE